MSQTDKNPRGLETFWRVVMPGFHFGAEPGAVALGKLACRDCGLVSSGFQINFATQMGGEFRGAEGVGGERGWGAPEGACGRGLAG